MPPSKAATGIIEGIGPVEVRPLRLGRVTLPRGTPLAGRAAPVFAFLVSHPRGAVLVDTGLGAAHPAIDALYRPRRRDLVPALAAAGLSRADITAVVNTHLHFDHCGGNPLFPGVPIFVQRQEYEAARHSGYTIPDRVDFSGAAYRLLDGPAEVLPGLSALPTPGHTPGHQSVVIHSRDGAILIVGQAAYTADEYDHPQPGHVWGRQAASRPEIYLQSLQRLRDFAPRLVYFSHDPAVWRPP